MSFFFFFQAEDGIRDHCVTGVQTCALPIYPLRKSEIVNRKYEMEMAFSRGLYTGWFRGANNQELVHARFGKKRGVYLGEVRRVEGEKVFVDLQAPLKPGDGVVFDAGHPDQPEEGGRVYEIRNPKSEMRNSSMV